MIDLFLKWIKENDHLLNEIGISIDRINIPSEETDNKCVSVDYLSEKCLGRISIWESGDVDLEILEIETEKLLLYKHFSFKDIPDYNYLFYKYFKIMKNGFAE